MLKWQPYRHAELASEITYTLGNLPLSNLRAGFENILLPIAVTISRVEPRFLRPREQSRSVAEHE